MVFSSSNTPLLLLTNKIHFSRSQSFPWSQCQYSGSFDEVSGKTVICSSELGAIPSYGLRPVGRYCPSIPLNINSITRYLIKRSTVLYQYVPPFISVLLDKNVNTVDLYQISWVILKTSSKDPLHFLIKYLLISKIV